jgi:multiple sugar transport system substrate-binding protein
MKRSISLLISLLMLATLLLAACGPAATPAEPAATEPAATEPVSEEPTEAPAEATEAPASDVTLRMLVRPDEGNVVADYAAKFEQETGIKVAVDFVSWADITNKTLTTLAAGGGGYDIVFMPSADAPKLAAGGWFEPLNDMIPEGERGDWLESVVNFYTFDGDLLAMPWYSGGAHMAYNKDVLAAANVDPASIETWEDFMNACQAIQEANAAEFCFTPSAKHPGDFYYNSGTMIFSQGGEFFDEQGAPVFQNGTAALDTFTLLAEGVEKGYFNKAGAAMDDYETLIAFGTGNTAFLLDSTWAATQANRNKDLSTIVDKVGYILVPGSGDVRSNSFLYAGGLGVLKTSEHKEEAKQFLAFLTGADAQKDHAIKGANMPTRVALFEDTEIIEAWSGFADLAAQLSHGDFVPAVSWLDEFRTSEATAVQEVMNGTKTPQEAVDWLVTEADRLRTQ